MKKDKVLDTIKGYKKIGAFIITVMVVVFGDSLGLDPAAIIQIKEAGIAYIVGQGIADAGTAFNKSDSEPKITQA